MEEAAKRRKERLNALKNRKNVVSNNGEDENISEEPLPKPIFRSYKPQDQSLKDNALPQIKPSDVKEKVQDHLEAAQTKEVIEEVDLTNLAPRKPDWDLKRDVAKKLEKLEKRTQRAIAELIRERLKSSNEDLAQVVTAGGNIAQTEDTED